MPAITLGEQVKWLRRQRRLTQDELARATHISRALVCRIERGKSSPDAECIIDLAAALDVTPGELFPPPRQRPRAPGREARQRQRTR